MLHLATDAVDLVVCKPSTSVADPDPGSGAFLTPRFGIRDEQPKSYFLEHGNHFSGLKFFDADSGPGIEEIRIRDPGWKKSDPRSGINIPDLQHCRQRLKDTPKRYLDIYVLVPYPTLVPRRLFIPALQ